MSPAERKKLPVGIESFEKIRQENFYYVDKTYMIRDLLKNWAKVNLFTRPRRFGKSLNMSMLRAFFEIGSAPTLFEGLAISEETDLYEAYMGKFPVISISLKSVAAATFAEARALAVRTINEEARRLRFLLDSPVLAPEDKELFAALLQPELSDSALSRSLRELSELLRKHYGKPVVLLIDEYDVPLAKAHENGYYDPMVHLIRSLFEQALKTNDSLHFAVLTGCLHITRESIFTGLNNLKILSISDVQFDEYFGFTGAEVREMLDYYGIGDSYEDVRSWYDGYRFGNVNVYCPWDVICFCDKRKDDPTLFPESYWSNTSSNEVIRRLLEMSTAATRNEMERLIAGESIVKEIHGELTYRELYQSIENVWSVLFTTGYLTTRSVPNPRNRNIRELAIPNEEIRGIFLSQIQGWMQEVARKEPEELGRFCEAFATGDASLAENMFSDYLAKTISVRDTAAGESWKENFYHGFLLGLLSSQTDWLVASNRESGEGYADILVEIPSTKTGLVLELKYAGKDQLEAACRKALEQAEEKDYAAQLREDGMETILTYGIACNRKNCRMLVG